MTTSSLGLKQKSQKLRMSLGSGNPERVRSVFENAPRYFKIRGVDIRLRADTVLAYAREVRYQRGLDIGCGDGTISLQLVNMRTSFTLIDMSSSMVTRAKKNIPTGLEENVVVRQEDFAAAEFDCQKFDLIVSVGVIAHVDSPDEFLRKIRRLMRPDAGLILEFTDAYHPIGWVGRFSRRLKEAVKPAQYSTNKLSFKEVARMFECHRLRLESKFRYSRLPVPGLNRLLSHTQEYKLVKAMFGDCTNNRNASLGNEYICLLRAE